MGGDRARLVVDRMLGWMAVTIQKCVHLLLVVTDALLVMAVLLLNVRWHLSMHAGRPRRLTIGADGWDSETAPHIPLVQTLKPSFGFVRW